MSVADRAQQNRLEASLSLHMLALAALSGAVGGLFGGGPWALAAASGPLAALVYYRMLGRFTRRLVGFGRQPSMLLLLIGLVSRQLVCVLPVVACWTYLGEAWTACLLTLLIARHWIVVPAWSRGAPAAAA